MKTNKATNEFQVSAIFDNVYAAAEFFNMTPTKVCEGSVCRHFVVTLNKEKVEFSGKRRSPCYYRLSA